MATPDDVLPAAPAWFGHRVGSERRLGAVEPRPEGARWLDLGPRDELDLLSSAGGLRRRHLAELIAGGTPMAAPPAFDVPVARPSKILCLGKNFAAHAAEFGAELPEEPIFFCKLADSLLPHRGTILLPHWLESRVDHEIELCVVLGFADPERRGRRDVPAASALELVSGYTLLDDVTARSLQGEDRREGKPWLRSKSFDTFCPCGPWVVPRDSLPPLPDLAIRLSVGSELRQDSRLGRMAVGVEQALAYLSRHTTLRPGDLIAMGTPSGVGPLRPGDEVVGEIEGIGALVNSVARAPSPA